MEKLKFECKNGDTITVKRPNGLDIFEANGSADMGNGTFKKTIYYSVLLIRCWDKGKDLSYLTKLEDDESLKFYSDLIKFFDRTFSEDDKKKLQRQSETEKSQEIGN